MNSQSSETSPQLAQVPPRGVYAALMAGFVVAGALVAYGIGVRGSSQTANLSALAIVIAGVLGFAPSLVRLSGGMQTWGLLIFGASMARLLALLAVAFFFSQAGGIVRQPFWIGIVAGGVVVLLLETAAAFVILNRFDAVHGARPRAMSGSVQGSLTES